jgi:hypothetical protein
MAQARPSYQEKEVSKRTNSTEGIDADVKVTDVGLDAKDLPESGLALTALLSGSRRVLAGGRSLERGRRRVSLTSHTIVRGSGSPGRSGGSIASLMLVLESLEVLERHCKVEANIHAKQVTRSIRLDSTKKEEGAWTASVEELMYRRKVQKVSQPSQSRPKRWQRGRPRQRVSRAVQRGRGERKMESWAQL